MKLAIIALSLIPSLVNAAPCDPPKKPRPKRPKIIPKPCVCEPGLPGPPGEQGPPGKPGEIKVIQKKIVYRQGLVKPGLSLRAGVMGVIYSPHGDWAWGPAIGLIQPLGKDAELTIDVGLALPAGGLSFSPGRESGYLVRGGYTRYRGSWGLGVGVQGTKISGSSNNGHIDAGYLGVDLGVAYRSGRVRALVGPVLGGLRDSYGTQLSLGLAGSLFVTLGAP